MRMKNPPHPGWGIGEDIRALELTVAEMAEHLGISCHYLQQVIDGQDDITPEFAYRFGLAMGYRAAFLLRLQMGYRLAQARLHAHEIHVAHMMVHKAA